MIFRRRKEQTPDREDDLLDDTSETAGGADDDSEEGGAATEEEEAAEALAAVLALDDEEWRADGPFDVSEVDDLESAEAGPRIDLGSMIITGVPGSELRLQVEEESQQIVSAMLVLQTPIPPTNGLTPTEAYSSALELGAYAAPRSGGLWSELREEISASAVEAGGQAVLSAGPFGAELRRIIPVTSAEGEEGYQPSRMWVAEGPRWLLRGIVYGQAALEEDVDSPVVADVAAAFRQVVVRRGDEAMAPGDLLPLHMPAELVTEAPEANE